MMLNAAKCGRHPEWGRINHSGDVCRDVSERTLLKVERMDNMSSTNMIVKTSSFRQHTEFIFLLISPVGLFGSLAFLSIAFTYK